MFSRKIPAVFKYGLYSTVAIGGTVYALQDHDYDSLAIVRITRTAYTAVDIGKTYKAMLYSQEWDKNSKEYLEVRSKAHQIGAEKLLELCKANKGVYIKVGQHIGALDYLLPHEYVKTMRILHKDAPKNSVQELYKVIREDLMEPEDMFDEFESEPLGTASLAQVHRAKLKDGSVVAVKVQHHFVRKNLYIDLKWMEIVINAMSKVFPEFQMQWLVDETKKNIRQELDFLNEGRNAEKMAYNFNEYKWLKIPKIFWNYSSDRVLVMEYLEGGQVNDVKYIDMTPADHICHACWQLATQQPMSENTTRRRGHRNVCVVCGRSILRVRRYRVPIGRANEEEQRLCNVISSWIEPRELTSEDEVCVPCWLRARRTRSSPSQPDIQPLNSSPQPDILPLDSAHDTDLMCAVCGHSLCLPIPVEQHNPNIALLLEHQQEHKIDRYDICKKLADLYSKMIFLTGFVHCDPHPGNILVKQDPGDKEVTIVLLDHGLYTQLSEKFRYDYSKLWLSIIDRNKEQMKIYSERLGIRNELYGLFACMVTGRPWDSIMKGIQSTKPSSSEKSTFQNELPNILHFVTQCLENVDRQALLVLKTNDLIRSIEYALDMQGRLGGFVTMSKCCIQSVYTLEYKNAKSVFQKSLLNLKFGWSVMMVYVYSVFLALQYKLQAKNSDIL